MSIKGNSVTIEDLGGTKYKTNTTFEKKFFSENANDDPVEHQNQSLTEPVKSGTENNEQMISDKMPTQSEPLGGGVAPQMRPQRQIRLLIRAWLDQRCWQQRTVTTFDLCLKHKSFSSP